MRGVIGYAQLNKVVHTRDKEGWWRVVLADQQRRQSTGGHRGRRHS